MESYDNPTNETPNTGGTNRMSKRSKRVDFRWLVFKRGERAVPIVAVVGHEISAQFAFKNLTDKSINRLAIRVETNRLGEIDIRECSEDTFLRDVHFESRFGDMFRTTGRCQKIVYRGKIIEGQQEVQGWLRARVKKLEGPTFSTPGVPVDFLSVALTLRADYRVEGEESLRSVRLRAEEVTFVKKGNLAERIARKLKEEWVEFVVVSIFAWIVGLFSPSLYRTLKVLWETALGFFR